MASLETNNYHGLHEYSTFSASTIAPHRHPNTTAAAAHHHRHHRNTANKWQQCFCFVCRLSSRLIFHPVGPFRCCWDLFVMLLLIYTSVEIPYTIAFGQATSILFVGLFVDASLLIDIFLNFHTAYFDKYDNLRLVTNKKYICRKYFRTWFVIDFITCIPFDFIFEFYSVDAKNTKAIVYIKLLRIFRLLRIIKILRFVKMLRIFDAFMKQFIIREVIVFMKLFKIIFGMLMFAHFSACLWWFVGVKTSPSWIDAKDLRNNTDLSQMERYSYAWYWAVVTLFTTGYGDIVATNAVEQWVCSICILIGTCFFAYFVGTLTVLITEGDKIKSYEMDKLEEAQSFCEKKKLPKELTRAILTHIRYHCTYNYVFDESEILNILPSYLQHDIHTYVSKQFLLQLNIFKNQWIELPDFIIGLIAVKTKSISCNQNYKLYDIGDQAKEFYIQRTGRSVLMDKNGKEMHELARGNVCGEYSSILFKRRKCKIQCQTWSEFYSINIDDIKEILDLYYPKSAHSKWKKIKKYVKYAYKRKVNHCIELNNGNYADPFLSDADTNGFNAPSVHSLFSYNKNNTNRKELNLKMNNSHEDHSVHLFNNTRDTLTFEQIPPTPTPIPPITPAITPAITPVNTNMVSDSEIIIVTREDSIKPKMTPIAPKMPSKTRKTAKSTTAMRPGTPKTPKMSFQSKSHRFSQKHRTASVATPTYSTRDITRVATPKRNTFAAKFHMRSNSELRDFIVVTHAEKHNKYSRPTAKIKHNKSDSIKMPSIGANRTATLRRFESSPVIKMDVTENLADVNKEFEDIVNEYKKGDSIKSFSSASINDSECSYSSISTDRDSSFEGDTDTNKMATLKRSSVIEHKNSTHLANKQKKIPKKKPPKKKKKGKGKFGGRGGRGGGGSKQKRVGNRNMSNHDRDRNMIKHKKHKLRFPNESEDNDSEPKTPKPRESNYITKRMSSIDPSVLLAPLNNKSKTEITQVSDEMGYAQSMSMRQTIQNINININGDNNGDNNVFVMSADYESDLTDDCNETENEMDSETETEYKKRKLKLRRENWARDKDKDTQNKNEKKQTPIFTPGMADNSVINEVNSVNVSSDGSGDGVHLNETKL